ncbi:MAG: hypothetical protein IKT81_04475 [Clostridia bacterium]|nr:hypothetical protein [Clostridia bacterium]
MSRYIPFPFYHDDVPLDLSFVYESEKPAGKHGFLTVKDGDFYFEDGTLGRFWGTNFNGGANFPDERYAETVAKRLAKIGVNIVRFHQLDAEWDTPNLYSMTKGKRLKNTRSFDPESMRRLDYLIYCLKKEGIYGYIDILTYRRWKIDDGVENADLFPRDNHLPYCMYDRRMIELQKEAIHDFFNHYNPYTGLKHCDDPFFVMGEVINECDMFTYKIVLEPYVSQFRQLFREWLDKNGITYDAENCDINAATPELHAFRTQVQREYFVEMMDCMRQNGVKFPLTGTNWSLGSILNYRRLAANNASLAAHDVCDFTDSHAYQYDWNWDQNKARQTAFTQFINPETNTLARFTLDGKPFFCSEWDLPWPNEFRAESPILYAAIGSFQKWAGFAIHTYAYSTRLDNMKMLGKEVSSKAIGNIAYREGIFSTWNDPAKFGLFYHAALVTRRQDVKPCQTKKLIHLEADPTLVQISGEALETQEYCMVRGAIHKNDDTLALNERVADTSAGEMRSVDGQLYRNWSDKNYGTIDTDRTKCAYGFLAKNGTVEFNGLSVKSHTDFAVIALSSLTDDGLQDTDNILMTAVGRARNTGAKFDGEYMLDIGTAPVEIEVIEAEISLKTKHERGFRVWSVNAEGFYYGIIPSRYEDGCLKFEIGKDYPSMYYLITKE